MKTRFLHIQVFTDSIVKADIQIPVSLLKTTAKFPALALQMIPKEVTEDLAKQGINLHDINMGELMHMVKQGRLKEKIIDIKIFDPVEGEISTKVYIDGN
ncbi:MAG: hypothetical protein ACOX4H_08985 [Bacillota bacterium]|jgi:hypothetical protein|nr:hypothetical protein [Clostridia bacterium]